MSRVQSTRDQIVAARASIAYGCATACLTGVGLAFSVSGGLAVVLFVLAAVFAICGWNWRHAEQQALAALKVDYEEVAKGEGVALRQLEKHKELHGRASNSIRSVIAVMVDDLLVMLALRMQMGAKERITLYRRTGDDWAVVGRYSEDVLLSGVSDEVRSGDGVIQRAFRTREFFIEALSQPGTPEYLAEQKALGLTAVKVKKLSMQSRSYFAVAFGSRDGRRRDCVVLVESLDPNGLDQESLRSCLDDETLRLARSAVELSGHGESLSLGAAS